MSRLVFLLLQYTWPKDSRGRVDRHGGGDVIERDPIEKDLHIFQCIDGHADLSNFTSARG